MKPMKRKPVKKGSSSRSFNNSQKKTKVVNVAPPPMRGGYRM